MAAEVVTLAGDVTAGEGKRRVSAEAAGNTSSSIWIVDREGRLVGVLEVGILKQAADELRLEDLAVAPKAMLSPHAALSTVLREPAWEEADDLPVVDFGGMFVGVLSHRRLRAWARTEAGGEGTDAFRTVLGLGELMWLGLHGLVDAVASTVVAEEQK
jgi:Mg/Co/Ni transporter MgtE